MYIGVVGDGMCPPEVAEAAEKVGAELARRGCVVVCGGLGGVMEAACRGAKQAGGLTVGILPGNDRRAANPFVDVAIVTGLGELRNGLVVKSSEAIIAVGGRYGTLSEIALALKLGRPVVGLDTWQLYREGGLDRGILVATTPRDAVEIAISLASQ
ncbi:MAG: TIGR00725 family protein [Chloroflexi bacterium]|nr:TIGR00725 family protein [Chloroflexota bacterium]